MYFIDSFFGTTIKIMEEIGFNLHQHYEIKASFVD